MKNRVRIPTLVTAAFALGAAIVFANDFEDALKEIARQASANYQSPPRYSSNSGNYYPYAAPPSGASETQQKQHAYDVGYRVGQDDYHDHHSKHFTRHPDLFDKLTHDAFAKGYDSGYDHAREASHQRERAYQQLKASREAVPSEHYASGYYPYAAPHPEAGKEDRQRHAYEVGFRVGQDDFYKGVSKHFTRHDKLFDKDTHDAFAHGYDQGYDQARSHQHR